MANGKWKCIAVCGSPQIWQFLSGSWLLTFELYIGCYALKYPLSCVHYNRSGPISDFFIAESKSVFCSCCKINCVNHWTFLLSPRLFSGQFLTRKSTAAVIFMRERESDEKLLINRVIFVKTFFSGRFTFKCLLLTPVLFDFMPWPAKWETKMDW